MQLTRGHGLPYTLVAKRADGHKIKAVLALSVQAHPRAILKADILRYLLLWSEGGVYNDLDVSCKRGYPFDEWIPPQYRDSAGVVVGLEFDLGIPRDGFRTLATWTIMSRPGSPHIWAVVEDIFAGIWASLAEKNITAAEWTKEMVGVSEKIQSRPSLQSVVMVWLSRTPNHFLSKRRRDSS